MGAEGSSGRLSPGSARTPDPLGLSLPGVAIPFGLGEPSPQRLDLGVQLAAVDGKLNALILHVSELLAQLNVLCHHGQEIVGALAVVGRRWFRSAGRAAPPRELRRRGAGRDPAHGVPVNPGGNPLSARFSRALARSRTMLHAIFPCI